MSIKEKVLQLFFFLQILIWCPQNDEFLKNPEKIRDDQKRFSKLSIQIKWCKEFCFEVHMPIRRKKQTRSEPVKGSIASLKSRSPLKHDKK